MMKQTAAGACVEINTTLANGVLHISLNREAKKNALTMPMFSALATAFADAGSDTAVKSLLITGKGSGFSAGHDLQAFSEWPQAPSDPVPKFLHALAQVDKPLIMAVHGAAIGIGATMLMHADWVCCTADARLRFPFIDIAIGPEAGSSLLLGQVVGAMRAKQLLLGGETFSGRQAYEWGLVSEIVEPFELVDKAFERARNLGEKPSALYRQIKNLLRPTATELSERINAEIALINQSIATARSS